MCFFGIAFLLEYFFPGCLSGVLSSRYYFVRLLLRSPMSPLEKTWSERFYLSLYCNFEDVADTHFKCGNIRINEGKPVYPLCEYKEKSSCYHRHAQENYVEGFTLIGKTSKRAFYGYKKQKNFSEAMKACTKRGYLLLDFMKDKNESHEVWDLAMKYHKEIGQDIGNLFSWTSINFSPAEPTAATFERPFTWMSTNEQWKFGDGAGAGLYQWDIYYSGDSTMTNGTKLYYLHECVVLRGENNALRPISCSMPAYFMCYKHLQPWEIEKEPIGRGEVLGCECGVKNEKEKGASESEHLNYEFPWTVMLDISFKPFKNVPPAKNVLCDGSILNDKMILTTATCVLEEAILKHPESTEEDALATKINVHLFGGTVTKGEFKTPLTASVIKPHPEFFLKHKLNKYELDNDIALVLLDKPIDFQTPNENGAMIRPVCLTTVSKRIHPVGKHSMVEGRDIVLSSHGKQHLKRYDAPIVNVSECERWEDYLANRHIITDNFLCHGLNKKAALAHPDIGDRGGPMVVEGIEQKGKWYQLGITSFVSEVYEHPVGNYQPGDEKRSTGVIPFFSRVQNYIRFIEYNARDVGASWCMK